ncbi:hypothetical protein BJF79_28540 [Actinomadura sp. CNU-125]|uniref:hypothetical protein n=1 Tax=Actinomadura sp. CNU-125 TaxID=1904961 RepID=UPI00095B22EB|nr:hypothetical protein [Actinomadura sp. CNU-125]OLT37893.1 hypothetical protein BJF79_28540 [Actinomadura sp. CNU-125]
MTTISQLTDPLASIRATVQHHPGLLDTTELEWLRERIAAMTDAWHTPPFTAPLPLVHGGTRIDNLMRHQVGHIVLGDWDSVAIGPREWEPVHSHHGQRRFGLSPADVDDFTNAYG